jgi:hypothetical protein
MRDRGVGQTSTEFAVLLGFVVIAIIIAAFVLRNALFFVQRDEPSVFAEIDRALEELPVASVAFNAPTTLDKGESTVIQLLLSLDKPISDLRDQLDEVGETEGARVRVSPQVEARLTGPGFKIEPIRPERPAGR